MLPESRSLLQQTGQTVSLTGIYLTPPRQSEKIQSGTRRVNPHLHKGWKPVTLRYHVLSSFIIICLSLVAVLEVLSYYSTGKDGENGGGLAFAARVDNLPTTASFFYLYFPTVLAVIYSMLWSWVDLDVKRLEPWFQLSKVDGATAKDSLLLHYPFEFLAFVPIKALRRRYILNPASFTFFDELF